MVIHNGADVSIDTQSEEERMQMHRFIEHLNNSTFKWQRNYDFQIKRSGANALVKDG